MNYAPLSTNKRSDRLKSKAAALLELRRRAQQRAEDLTIRSFIAAVAPHYQLYDHIEQLIDVLERVERGELRRVMIFMPPRHGKSLLVSRLFSAYYLIKHPDRWVGINSYAAELAYTFSRSAREHYLSFGGGLAGDASAVKHWETGQGGGLWASGVGGPITGKGFHLGIIDDPLKNAEEAASTTLRATQREWYKSTFRTRAEPGAAILLILTRWNAADLAGWLLKEETDGDDAAPQHWHIVSMEALKEPAPFPFPATCTVEPDQRAPGEALCPERYDAAALDEIRRQNHDGPVWWNLYQQRPQAEKGAIFDAAWWDVAARRNRYASDDGRLRHTHVQRWQFWDTALKDADTNDPSACITADLLPSAYGYRLLVRHVLQERLLGASVPDKVEEMATRWNFDDRLRAVVVEDKGSGTTTIQTLRATAPTWLADRIVPWQPRGAKEVRARLASIWCARDMVELPYPAPENADWYDDFCAAQTPQGQLFKFPFAAHDDMVDCFTMMILYLEHYLRAGWHAEIARQNAAA